MNVLEGAVLTAEFEVKAARLLGVAGLPRLVAEPAFYGAFVVGALSSTGGGIDPQRALFLVIGVVGIQCVGMMSQVIYRWTLERKWALGSLKLSSGVPQLGYYLGMLLVPLLSLLARASVALLVVATICSFTLRVDPVALAAGVALCGLFWSAHGPHHILPDARLRRVPRAHASDVQRADALLAGPGSRLPACHLGCQSADLSACPFALGSCGVMAFRPAARRPRHDSGAVRDRLRQYRSHAHGLERGIA